MNKVHKFAFCPECGQKLEGTESKCPKCNFVFVQEPSVEKKQEAPVVKEDKIPPVAAPVFPPAVEEKPAVVEEKPVEKKIPPAPPTPPVNKPTPMAQAPKKKSKALMWILIILGVIIVLLAAFAGLIKFGVISAKTVDFLPPTVMKMLKPVKSNSNLMSKEEEITDVYYVCYDMAYMNNEKVAVVSNVIKSDSESSIMGAQNEFKNILKLRFPNDYFEFSNVICKQYTDFDKAVSERENVKKDYLKDDCKIETVDVVY
jgi:hypothetical protein